MHVSCLCWSSGWWWSVVPPRVLQVKWGSIWWINLLHLPFSLHQPRSGCSWELPQVIVPFLCTVFWSDPFKITNRISNITILSSSIDESFTSFHPEAHLPLSFMRGRPVYVEVSLLDPPEPDLVLLVHSCLAYTQAPYISRMLVYDGYVFITGKLMNLNIN